MRIGIPAEVKPGEGRVGLIPSAAGEVVKGGHEVFLQQGAGLQSGYRDEDYLDAGIHILPDAAAVYAHCRMIVKVKEPIESEYALLRSDHILFSYLHLAANRELTEVLCSKGLTALAFETVSEGGRLPLLAPMSDIAGRLSVQIGATLLHSTNGGRGLLLGGLPAADRGTVVVLGAGVAGGNAAALAAALGARVIVHAPQRESLERMHRLGPNVTALPSYAGLVERSVQSADLLIGAVLIPGAKAPRIVTEAMVRGMQPGSVIVDISVDQGGCVETIRPTNYEHPTYVERGVVHFGVTNMPGAVPRTASQALSTSLTSYVLRLAAQKEGVYGDSALAAGLNVREGRIVHPAVAGAMGRE